MKRFLRENWIYIVAPIVIVIVLRRGALLIGGVQPGLRRSSYNIF
jgi:hypothetical protein